VTRKGPPIYVCHGGEDLFLSFSLSFSPLLAQQPSRLYVRAETRNTRRDGRAMRMLSAEEEMRQKRAKSKSEREREKERGAIQGVADRSFVRGIEEDNINRQINRNRGPLAIRWN